MNSEVGLMILPKMSAMAVWLSPGGEGVRGDAVAEGVAAGEVGVGLVQYGVAVGAHGGGVDLQARGLSANGEVGDFREEQLGDRVVELLLQRAGELADQRGLGRLDEILDDVVEEPVLDFDLGHGGGVRQTQGRHRPDRVTDQLRCCDAELGEARVLHGLDGVRDDPQRLGQSVAHLDEGLHVSLGLAAPQLGQRRVGLRRVHLRKIARDDPMRDVVRGLALVRVRLQFPRRVPELILVDLRPGEAQNVDDLGKVMRQIDSHCWFPPWARRLVDSSSYRRFLG